MFYFRVLMIYFVLRFGLIKIINYIVWIANFILKKDMFLSGIIRVFYNFDLKRRNF